MPEFMRASDRARRLPAKGAGAVAAALILSSCTAVGLHDDPELAGPAGPADDQVDVAAPERPVGAPLQLIPSTAFDWVHAAAPPSVADISGAEAAGSIWAGLPLITDPLTLLAVTAPEAPTGALPLLVADGQYYDPAPVAAVASGETHCLRESGLDVEQVACAAWDDQIAMAPVTVDDSLLAEQRGGFITVSGLQIDFGIHVETLVNGVTTLTTALTLDDVINGGLESIQIGQVTVGGADGTTDIVHNVGLGNVNTVVNNSQDDIDITTLATLAIDVINLQQPQVGNSFGAGPRMAPEMQQSIIRGINR